MCTLTFVPQSDNIIISSNRDEHISRGNSLFPVHSKTKSGKVYFPQDPMAGGTWIAVSASGKISVLLNGAFEKHKHRPPYRLSRGIILLDTFAFGDLLEFEKNYDLNQIEPFTLVQFHTEAKKIYELRWDGQSKYIKTLDFTTPHIWSSSTLYSKEIRSQREQWFDECLKQNNIDLQTMLNFHQFGGNGEIENAISMNRGNGLQTVSISQIEVISNQLNFSHHNFIGKKFNTVSIP